MSHRIDRDSMVDLMFHLTWKSDRASHTDCYQACGVNVWRDHLPEVLLDSIMNKQTGERIELRLKQGEILPDVDPIKIFEIKCSQFDRRFGKDISTEPCPGRFYPKGMLKGVTNVFKENVEPFRVVGRNNDHLKVDFNHPLSGKRLTLSAIVGKVTNKLVERGGSITDWIATLTDGPGMQARWKEKPSEYFSDVSFARDDETPDSEFYAMPRFTNHMDVTAIEMVRHTYGRFLNDGMRVLDLMSSWQSHIPGKLKLEKFSGLGLNEEELKRNQQLSDYVVHDLNADPSLPFESNSFDAVLCTVSIEYLVHPLSVFDEIARILEPQGYFIITFSNRWFPTKAIKIWRDIHEFERMGLVLEYFIRSESFSELKTYSIRGLPRPRDDKYFPDLRFSDPVYAVWGRKR